jgi:hypothetical protein
LRRTAGRSWMRVAEDRARWREIGEAYVQQWADDDDEYLLDRCLRISSVFIETLVALLETWKQFTRSTTFLTSQAHNIYQQQLSLHESYARGFCAGSNPKRGDPAEN